MNGNFRPVSRRDFLIRSALFTAGACAGAALLPGPLARALDRLAESSPAPRIGFILDDVGASFERVKPFLDLEFPATFSVLPRLQHSAGIADHGRYGIPARDAHRRGHQEVRELVQGFLQRLKKTPCPSAGGNAGLFQEASPRAVASSISMIGISFLIG